MANEPKEPGKGRWHRWRRALAAGVLGLALGVAGTAFVIRAFEPPAFERPNLPALPAGEVDPAVWGHHYPRHMDSYLRGLEMSSTKYGGSVPEDKLRRMPWLVRIFSGFGFAEEYFEDRGHPYALEDVLHITQKRQPAAVCFTCKTAELPVLLEKYGKEFYNMPFDQVAGEIKHPIACADCHDPQTMALRITRPALVEALRRQGTDVENLTRNEMRTMVCAQCHVEYYFQPGTREVVFPWHNGVKVDQVEAHFDEIGFKDYVHADSGADIVKIQHPDYEFYVDSTHHAAGVSCADCHMPFVREGNVKITSHWWTSPIKHMQQSCTVCHRQSVEYLTQRVLYSQDKVYASLNQAGEAMVEAIDAIKAAAAQADANQELVQQARALHRKAQIRLDWIASENSMGFHNPQEALDVLGQATNWAYQAKLTAIAATGAIPPPVAPEPPEVPQRVPPQTGQPVPPGTQNPVTPAPATGR